jgi:hypothetical protein
MGGRPLRLPGMGGGGKKSGGTHGVVAREEGEATLGRCEEEERRVAAWARRTNGPAG